MRRWSAIGTVLCFLSPLSLTMAQEKEKAREKEHVIRQVYSLQHGQAAELAKTLTSLFQDEATILVSSESHGGQLLLKASPATMEMLTKMLHEIDRPRCNLALELFLVDIQVKLDEGKPIPSDKRLDDSLFTGSLTQVQEQLDLLKKKGQLVGLRRLKLATAENRPTRVTLGESKPFVTGVIQGPRGLGNQQSVSYQQVGMTVEATACVKADGKIEVDLKVEDTNMRASPEAAPGGNDAIRAPQMGTTSLKTFVQVPPRSVVVAKRTLNEGAAQYTLSLILVTGHKTEDESRSGK